MSLLGRKKPQEAPGDLPARTRAGAAIPPGVRGTIPQVVGEQQAMAPGKLWHYLARRHGIGSWEDLLEDTADRFGEDRANKLKSSFEAEWRSCGARRLDDTPSPSPPWPQAHG